MTVEEEEGEAVVADKNSVTMRTVTQAPKEVDKKDYVRSKMEAMQRRINELKEKVKYEGELLHKEDNTVPSDFEIKSKYSIDSQGQDIVENIQEDDQNSEKSLYFSASSFSLCTVSSSSSVESSYQNFNRFVNNFMKNQNQKERLSLLQLHSNKQISLNMMRHSLTELDSRCSEELELIERSLQHLTRLAEEFSVKTEEDKPKALEFSGRGDSEPWNSKRGVSTTFIWPPLKENDPSKAPVDWRKNPAFLDEKKDDYLSLDKQNNLS